MKKITPPPWPVFLPLKLVFANFRKITNIHQHYCIKQELKILLQIQYGFLSHQGTELKINGGCDLSLASLHLQ